MLGNAGGPGIAVGVTEDVARAPRETPVDSGRGGSGSASVVAPEPIQPEPPAARVRKRVRGCTRIERPRILERPRRIEFVEQARIDGAEGRMVLRLHISARGRVTRVEVKQGVHPALQSAAIAAARTWRFQPESRCGTAVASTFVIARRFELVD